MKLSVKILISLLLISLVPLGIVVGLYNHSVDKMIDDKVSVFFEQIVKQNAAYIDREIGGIEQVLNAIVGNELIQDELDYYGNKTNMERLESWLRVDSTVNSVFALNMNIRSVIFSLYESNKVKIFGEDALDSGIYYTYFFQHEFDKDQFAPHELDYPKWQYKLVEDTSRIYVMKELISYGTGNPIGIVTFAVDTDFLGEVITSSNTGNSEDIFLLDEMGRYVYDKDKELLGEGSDKAYIQEHEEESGLVYEGDNIIVYVKLHNRFTLIGKVAVANLTKDIRIVRGTIMAVALVAILVAVFISILFSKYVSRKFRALIGYMKRVQQGDFDIQEKQSPKGADEFNVIFNYFFKMVKRLKQLIQTNYVVEIEKKEAKLNALQYQVNPHFLYNTLEVIRSMSLIHDCEEIGEVSHKLGELFRYNLNRSSNDYIPMKEEMVHIKNYVYLMNIHYNNRIQLFIDIPEHLMNDPILRFILQPILENSIMYGFASRSGEGCIEIDAKQDKNTLTLHIADDGTGITKERLEEVREYIYDTKYSQNSVGLRNVHQRMLLAYGEGYGVSISSDAHGTVVSVKMPYNKSGN